MSIVPSFLRWAGSKRAALPILREFMPTKYIKYVEPFAGSACVFFAEQPLKAALGDLNIELIDAFVAVKADPKQVSYELSRLSHGRDAYYEIRKIDPRALTAEARAARFIYLNRFCFNGLYRTNKQGVFNVPYGAPRNFDLPTLDRLSACSRILQTASLESSDFQSVIADHVGAGDFVYLDPPYFQTEGRLFRQYNAKPFMKSDLGRLSDVLKYIDSIGANFLLSYAANDDAAGAFPHWERTEITLQRNIAGFSHRRGKAKELIVANYSLRRNSA